MSASKNTAIEQKQKAQWHYDNCTIETEQEYLGECGYNAYCVEHLVDVTSCMPEPIEPDPYDNSEENEGYASMKDAKGF